MQKIRIGIDHRLSAPNIKMGAKLREALEKHLFNYTWGDPDGVNRKVFTSTDIRLGASGDDDFTLRASNLKEALAKIKKGNFAVCPVQAPFVPSGEDPGKKDPKLFTASGCPVTFPHATRGLVKVEQRGGDRWRGRLGDLPRQDSMANRLPAREPVSNLGPGQKSKAFQKGKCEGRSQHG